MRNIQKNEHITFDYAMVLSVESYNIKCLCGSKNCRKYITGNDWKIPTLQKKYKGYFQPYLENKIKKLDEWRAFINGVKDGQFSI